MFDDPFDGDNGDDEYAGYSQSDFPGFPFNVDDKPGGELGEIFDSNGWSTWGDFASEKWGSEFSDDPSSQRSGMFADLTDAIFNLNDTGALDWANFWLDDDGFIHYEVESTP